ncbi:hypothetical protein OpiT1DRAFT_00723 [Opitutaceae bacterium TAV1]|nr:hypothetical protein OpiT1DRAFT_00723 [Opitutaceae bacterium TAV1]
MNSTNTHSVRMRLRPLLACVALAVTSAVLLPAASAAIIIYDSFTGSNGPLDNRLAETDTTGIPNNTWNRNGTSAYLEGGMGAIITSSTAGNPLAWIGINSPVADTTISVSAEIVFNPTTSYNVPLTQKVEWVSIGFGKSTSAGWLSSDNLLSVRITPGGAWELYIDIHKRASGTLDGSLVAANTVFTATIRYDTENNLAAFFLGETNISGWTNTTGYDTGNISSTLIAAAGFRINSGSGVSPRAAAITSFTVSDLSQIPEPSATAFLAGGIMLVLLMAKRCRRSIR